MVRYEHVQVTDPVVGVRVVTIDRPGAKNALNAALRRELGAALAAADGDDSVRAIVLTAVDPVFSAGVDFKEVSSGVSASGDDEDGAAGPTTNPAYVMRGLRTPVICAVNGACVSGALEVALSASFIVASERARFADTHAQLGVAPTWGLTALLPRAVGVRTAREMSLTGRFMDAHQAHTAGLVNHVVPHDELVSFVVGLASQIPAHAAVGDMLGLYAGGEDLSHAGALAAEKAFSVGRRYDLAAFGAAGRAVAARQRSGPTTSAEGG